MARNASSFVASASVSPSTYGHGYQVWRCPDATAGSRNVSIRTYLAEDSGRANWMGLGIEKQMLGSGGVLGQLPAPAAHPMHGRFPPLWRTHTGVRNQQQITAR